MKKLYQSAAAKRRGKRKSRNALRKKLKRRGKKYIPKPSDFYNEPVSASPSANPPLITIRAPDNFSLVNNTEEVLSFFREAYLVLKKGDRALLDISEIKTLTTDAIAVQVAKICDRRFLQNSEIQGNSPKNEGLRQLFLESGFFNHVQTQGRRFNAKNKLIHKVTKNRVEPDLVREACLYALRHVYGNSEPVEPLYDILIEVMQNTNNHAGLERGKYDWWLNIFNDPNSKKSTFTFVDLGAGIFESLPVKTFKKKFIEMFGLTNNLKLVPKLFNGEIKSRTARPERGKGIPQIFECSQDNVFSKFLLISNDVYADLKDNGNNRLLDQNFDGTLFFWELENSNES